MAGFGLRWAQLRSSSAGILAEVHTLLGCLMIFLREFGFGDV